MQLWSVSLSKDPTDTFFSFHYIQGPFTGELGYLGYNELCHLQKTSGYGKWKHVWDDNAEVPFTVLQQSWVSYESPESISLKAAYAYNHGLAGVMVWSIDTDDFLGDCGQGKNPLLTAINRALAEREESGRRNAVIGTILATTCIFLVAAVAAVILLLYHWRHLLSSYCPRLALVFSRYKLFSDTELTE